MLEINKIYLGDCMDFMKQIPDKSIDLVLTDPPYSEATHVGMRSMKGGSSASTVDFASFSFSDILRSFNEIGRISKGWVVSFIEWTHAAKIHEIGISGLDFTRLAIWYKPNAIRQLSADRPAMGWEAILIMHASGLKKEWNGGGRLGVFVHNNVRSGRFIANFHPVEKPLGLVSELITLFSNQGDIVLDPFMGSGTIPLAALRLGRRYIGIEIKENYFQVARKRIEPWLSQERLMSMISE
jgi:site-specific DNA-methyltransferase (adenine-specific)